MLQNMLIFVILKYCAAGSVEETPVQFVADYFAYKGTRMVTTFACSSRGTLVHLSLTTCTYTQFKKEIIYLLEAYLSKK
jgi:hypothetical protein